MYYICAMRELEDNESTRAGLLLYDLFFNLVAFISTVIIILGTIYGYSTFVFGFFTFTGIMSVRKLLRYSRLKRQAEENGMTTIEYINYLNKDKYEDKSE